MITKARKWIMVASLMLTMCFAINNSTSAKAAVVTEVATQNLKLNNAINEAKNEYEGGRDWRRNHRIGLCDII